ncbi:VOC family protein [Chitiniphilus eburneus]|uniref:VOC family protein n=1 Tax=Chitiniphilus eburneus TaxID=2571148 RepID=A0A4U0PAF5_9NEIS|nr:VOC family protein [Chitiniphilus eburneus]TJZ64603.1 VOC family protein [Chitiniphilus eburneus]
MQQQITPCLWFDGQAETAARFYVSVFRQGQILATTYYPDGMPQAGTVLTVEFELNGQVFTALNGGPEFQFSPAVSFAIRCDTQEEVDHYWDSLTEAGQEHPCGWLVDMFGVSWQVVPQALMDMLSSGDKAGTERAVAAMMTMKKLDIAALQRAYQGA